MCMTPSPTSTAFRSLGAKSDHSTPSLELHLKGGSRLRLPHRGYVYSTPALACSFVTPALTCSFVYYIAGAVLLPLAVLCQALRNPASVGDLAIGPMSGERTIALLCSVGPVRNQAGRSPSTTSTASTSTASSPPPP